MAHRINERNTGSWSLEGQSKNKTTYKLSGNNVYSQNWDLMGFIDCLSKGHYLIKLHDSENEECVKGTKKTACERLETLYWKSL